MKRRNNTYNLTKTKHANKHAYGGSSKKKLEAEM